MPNYDSEPDGFALFLRITGTLIPGIDNLLKHRLPRGYRVPYFLNTIMKWYYFRRHYWNKYQNFIDQLFISVFLDILIQHCEKVQNIFITTGTGNTRTIENTERKKAKNHRNLSSFGHPYFFVLIRGDDARNFTRNEVCRLSRTLEVVYLQTIINRNIHCLEYCWVAN